MGRQTGHHSETHRRCDPSSPRTHICKAGTDGGTAEPAYALARSDEEYDRLSRQAAFLRGTTERLFRTAGLAPGMRVLDVGSGVGDVALLAAEFAGAGGEVVGVDVDGEALRIARGRAQSLGRPEVTFIEGDVFTAELAGGFDETFARAGMQVRMGRQLFGAFLAAGLPAPTMRDEALVGGGPDFGGYAWVAGVARSVAPMMEKLALADPRQLGLDTLADRIRDDTVAAEAVVWTPSFVGAYARKPEG